MPSEKVTNFNSASSFDKISSSLSQNFKPIFFKGRENDKNMTKKIKNQHMKSKIANSSSCDCSFSSTSA